MQLKNQTNAWWLTNRPFVLLIGLGLCLVLELDGSNQLGGQEKIIEQIKKRQDKNSDGLIGKSEATGQLKKSFDRVDRNRDGSIDDTELKELARRLQRNGQQNNANPRNRLGGRIEVPDDVTFQTDIAYRAGDPAWKLDLAMPKQARDTPRPALVFVHGGGWRGGDKRGGIWTTYPIHFAQRGYVCISINYRLSQKAAFPACVEDCKCAVRWLRAHAKKYNVDPDRIGAFGNSAGAHLVSMLGLTSKNPKLAGDGPYQDYSSAIQAVVPAATPADFTVWGKTGLGAKGRLLAGDESGLEKRAREASPVTYASKDAPPFLIVHGTADRTVPVDQGKRLAKALEDAGAKQVTLKIFDGAGHGVFRQKQEVTLPLMESFFDRHLKKTKPKKQKAEDRN